MLTIQQSMNSKIPFEASRLSSYDMLGPLALLTLCCILLSDGFDGNLDGKSPTFAVPRCGRCSRGFRRWTTSLALPMRLVCQAADVERLLDQGMNLLGWTPWDPGEAGLGGTDWNLFCCMKIKCVWLSPHCHWPSVS